MPKIPIFSLGTLFWFLFRKQNNSEGDTPAKGYAIVAYIRGVTEPIKRILSNCNIKIALKPYLTLGHIFSKPKDPVKTIDILYTLDSASNYSAIQKLKP
jgi:hypothetical protein